MARTFGTSTGVHHEGIANPEGGPAAGALRNLDGLAVHGHHHGRSLAHRTPANERSDIVAGDGRHRHGHGLRGGQPVGVVISGGEVAHVVDVTEQEGHRAELAQAAPSRAQVLAVRPLVALHVEQGVPVVKNFGPRRTLRVIRGLTVPGHQEPMINRWGAWGTHGSWQPVGTWWAWKPSWTRGAKGSRLSFLARSTVKTGNTWRSRQAHGSCHTLLSFGAWWSRKPLQTWGTLWARESWLSFDDVVGPWGAWGPREAFASREALVTRIALSSLQAGEAFLTLKSWNSRRSYVTLRACESWRATDSRQALESWISLGSWSTGSPRPAWVSFVTFQSIKPGEPRRPHGSRKPWQARLTLCAPVSFRSLHSVARSSG